MKVWQALMLIVLLFVILVGGTVYVFAQSQVIPTPNGPLVLQQDSFGNTWYQGPGQSGRIQPQSPQGFTYQDYTRQELGSVYQSPTGQFRQIWQMPTRERPASHRFCFQGMVPPAGSSGIGSGC